MFWNRTPKQVAVVPGGTFNMNKCLYVVVSPFGNHMAEERDRDKADIALAYWNNKRVNAHLERWCLFEEDKEQANDRQ